MGCNGSKQADVQRDRQRIARQPENRPSNKVSKIARSDALVIGGKPMNDDDETEGVVYGTSYTNKKTKEYNFLHDIVTKTRSDFIDVSQQPQDVTDNMDDRTEIYAKRLASLGLATAFDSMFTLPKALLDEDAEPNTLTAVVHAALDDSATISTADVNFIKEAAASIGEQVKAVQVQSSGAYVLTFDQL
mmetsp:Transcript_8582/g.16413  ORF Transcript_8582/g.16413 Transcript_8582/m.16413 type:complete len:189 (+) Transcript_8582:82-648(+)